MDLSNRQIKNLRNWNKKHLPNYVISLMSRERILEYEKLRSDAKVDYIHHLPMMGGLVLLYSVFINMQFAQTLGMAGVGGYAITLIIVLFDFSKTYSALQLGDNLVNKEKLSKVNLLSLICFATVAIYAFYTVQLGNNINKDTTTSNYEAEKIAYDKRIATLEASINQLEAEKVSPEDLRRAENALAKTESSLEILLNKTIWVKGRKNKLSSQLGNPICEKINGYYTRTHCAEYKMLVDKKARLDAKIVRLQPNNNLAEQREQLAKYLAEPPQKPKMGVSLNIYEVLILGFLIELLGLSLIMQRPRVKKQQTEAAVASNMLKKFVKNQITLYLNKIGVNNSIEIKSVPSMEPPKEVVTTKLQQNIAKYLKNKGFKNLANQRKLNQDHIDLLLNYRGLRELMAEERKTQDDKGNTGEENLLLEVLNKEGVTTLRNRRKGLSAKMIYLFQK